MRWVHRGCLEEWRRAAAPGSDTFLACDMCKTRYRFHARPWQRMLGSEPFLFLYSVVLCGVLVGMAVAIAAECRTSLEDILPVIEEAAGVTYNSQGAPEIFHPLYRLVDRIQLALNLIHSSTLIHESYMSLVKNVFCGLAALSLLQLLIVDGSVGLSFNLMFSLWRLAHYNFRLDYVLSGVFIVIGIMRMGVEVHKGVRVGSARLLTLKIANYHEKRD